MFYNFSASFLITFLSFETATSINIHVLYYYFIIIIIIISFILCGFVLFCVVFVFLCWLYNWHLFC
jgi:hypothetical protein